MISRKSLVVATIVVGLTAIAHPTSSHASDTVLPGWDLLQTDPNSTMFFGHAFEGVPLGTFDFDAAIGIKDVGPTDTLIRRVNAATVPGPGDSFTVLTVVDAFQLRSVDPVTIMNGPVGIYYITLQSLRGGPVSTGSMTIGFGPEGDPHGTYSSSFNLFVDVRLNALDGPILDSRLVTIPDSGSVPWRHDPTGPIQIPGVNINLNGIDTDNDFWIEGSVFKQTPNGSIGAHNAGVPDFGNTLLLLSVGLMGLGLVKTRSTGKLNAKAA